MPGYWVMRTASEGRSFIWSELTKGRLRQGWGYADNLNLEVLERKVAAGDPLTPEERACWRGNRRMLSSQPDGIREGDLVVLPNLPTRGTWSVARIVGGYSFDLPSAPKDFAHSLPAELLSSADRPVNPYEAMVPAKLRGSMRSQLRLFSINQFGKDVERIVDGLSSPPSVPNLQNRLENTRRKAEDAILEQLHYHFRGAEFEAPCHALLGSLFQMGNVEHRGGPTERGADFICTYTDALGTSSRIAVQVKHWRGGGDVSEALEQIKVACGHYEFVSSGIVMTLLDSCSPENERARQALEVELGIPVRILLKEDVLRLFLERLPEMGELASELK